MNNKIKAALILFGSIGGVFGFMMLISVILEHISQWIIATILIIVTVGALFFWWKQMVELLDDDNRKYKSKKAP
jgi:protein-S-isoprenylcysteine O-methyltransferase Ste14